MTATVHVEQISGTFPGTYKWKDNSGTEKSGTRYQTSDQWDGSLTTYPIPIPTVDQGASGSYWTTHCLNITVAPSTYIKNLRYYQTWTTSPRADWTLGSSNTRTPGLYIGISSNSIADARILTQGFHSGSYVQATGTEGTCGTLISAATTGYGFYSGTSAGQPRASGGMIPIDNFSDVSTSFMVQSGQVVGASTGRSYCIATQVIVGSGATQGEKADKTATFVYSEV